MRVSTGQLLCLLFFALPCATEEGATTAAAVTPRRRIVCVHGETNDAGRCLCEAEYVGRHCEKKKNCATFRRYRNGTCLSCIDGYSGPFCEDIMCQKGTVDPTGLKCICEAPYTGEFCAELATGRVYSYYNNKVLALGPLGVISIIPMYLILFFCEKFAYKRQVKRVSDMLGDNVANQKVLGKLLKQEDV